MKRGFWNAGDASGERAVIDIGSNTVRLVVFNGPPRAPAELLNEKVTARLGRGLGDSGHLSEKAMQAALAALSRYAALLKLRGTRRISTVATAATRDAANGAAFLDRVAALGLSPRQLSGEEEAVTSALGVIAAFPGAKGVVADLGGGSLELIDIDAGQSQHGTSLPLGTLRLPALRSGGPAKFARRIHRILEGADWSDRRGQPLYLVGGSFRAIARFAMHRLGWPLDDPHGFVLGPDQALAVCRAAARGKSATARGKVPAAISGLSGSRLASLPDAAALLAALVREIAPSELVFSSWGLREGVLHAGLPEAERGADPLLAGVAEFAARHGVERDRAALIAGWIAPVVPASNGGADRLRLASAMLALAAQQVEPNLRPGTARDWALRKRWIGIDAAGRAMIAAALAGNAARAFDPAYERLAPTERLRTAWTWGLAMRLCRRFSDGQPRVLAASALRLEGGRLVLEIAAPWHALGTDFVLKDLKMLAAALAAEPELRLV